MKRILVILLIAGVPVVSSAQLGGLINRAKNKVENRVNNKVDKGMDKALDDLEGKKPAAGSEATEESTKAGAAAAKSSLTSYSRFDFVPGEKVIYTEDFSQDVIGELPVSWNASGKGEVMTLEGHTGKWLRIHQGNSYLTGNKKSFGENFTIEFDLIYYFEPKKTGYVMPDVQFGVFSSGEKDNTDNEFLEEYYDINSTEVSIHPYGNSGARLQSYRNRGSSFVSDLVPVTGFMENFNKVLHYSLQVQRRRFRMWVNGMKVFDIPRAVDTVGIMNQMFFSLEGSNYQDDEIGLFLTNLKIATGLPDTRHKLVEEGKFSTTGILFDLQSAVIKPESHGVIREIAGVLKDNSSLKIKIIGHTSSDGDDTANMELSKKRAAAVKEALVKEYSIDGERLQAEGKGETQPVGDNKTKEGQAQNRRVEFVKL